MTPRFLADADLNRAIVTGVKRREPAVDFLTAALANLEGLEDPRVLAIAAQAGRILVSHDHKTMPRHFGEFVRDHESAGVFLVSQDLPVALAVETLLLVWATSDAEEWRNQLRYLPML